MTRPEVSATTTGGERKRKRQRGRPLDARQELQFWSVHLIHQTKKGIGLRPGLFVASGFCWMVEFPAVSYCPWNSMQIASLCGSSAFEKKCCQTLSPLWPQPLVSNQNSLKERAQVLPVDVYLQKFRGLKETSSFKPGRHALQIFHHRSTRFIAVLCTFDRPGKRCCDQIISFLMTSPINTIRTNGGCWMLYTLHTSTYWLLGVGCFAKFHHTGATFASEILGQSQELARLGGPFTKCGRAARAWSGTLFCPVNFFLCVSYWGTSKISIAIKGFLYHHTSTHYIPILSDPMPKL